MAWYSGDQIEQMTFHMRYFGPWGWMFWLMVLCNCLIPLLLFSPRIRVNMKRLWIISIFVNIGMWLGAFCYHRGLADYQLRSVAVGDFYRPSITEIMITVGSFAWFLGLFSLFARFLPIISMTELKEGIQSRCARRSRWLVIGSMSGTSMRQTDGYRAADIERWI